MAKILTTYFTQNIPKKFSDDLTKYLKEQGRTEQLAACRKANSWVHKLTGRNISGGTAIGKHHSSMVLDIQHQDGLIDIRENCNISVVSKEVKNFKEFEAEIRSWFELHPSK